MLKNFNFSLFVLLNLVILIVACGKKTGSEDNEFEMTNHGLSGIERYMERQTVACEDNQACPGYITKIVVVDRDKYKFCTGFLTEDNVVATSSSCLPSILRMAGQNCSKDVFFFFPSAANRPAERFGCTKVLQASALYDEKPIYWRDDVSFLQLSHDVSARRKVSVSREGVENHARFDVWMVNQQGEFSATIKKSSCEALHKNWVNPLVLNESSPNMVFADCALSNGGAGAPVVDGQGKVRAMLSEAMDMKDRAYLESTGLLFEGLKEMVHATNFACAPTLSSNAQLDERECSKDLSYLEVDYRRLEMFTGTELFDDIKDKVEASVVNTSKNIQLGVTFIVKDDVYEVAIHPKCFNRLDSWLNFYGRKKVLVESMKLPIHSFTRKMNMFGRIQVMALPSSQKDYYIQYSLKYLRNQKKSYVLTWSNSDPVRSFQGVGENCLGSSLL